MSKRSRDETEAASSPAWWHSTVEWVRSNGGTIDSRLVLTDERNITTTTSVQTDQVLMEIPATCLISRETIQSTNNGRMLDSIVNDESITFHNQREDLLLATSLADRNNTETFQRYLDTLPPSSDYDMLPRRWKDSDLQSLLTGSCLLDRVTTSREETRKDFDKIQCAWTKQTTEPFPVSFSDFDDMLAAVTSRAFAGMGESCSDESIAMVPLLDLCNHRRGNVTKNVSYSKMPNGSVRVVASEGLEANTTLVITYGARGNAQLLFNYGFCIPNNIEPDGSSNDILEFKAKEDQPPIELRSGPKSYTFGGFAKALEMFHDVPSSANDAGESNDMSDGGGMDDMEAFLNECEEEGEGIGWGEEEDEVQEDEASEEDAIKAELLALAAMGQAFRRSKEKYKLRGEELEQSLVTLAPMIRHYAAILVASELRTIYLHEMAIELVRARLSKEEPSLKDIARSVNLTQDDEESVKTQANELAGAFIGIRYPFLSY